MDDTGFFDAPSDKWQLQRQAMPFGVQKAPTIHSAKRIGVLAVPLSEYGEWGVLQVSEGAAQLSSEIGIAIEWDAAKAKRTLGQAYAGALHGRDLKTCISTDAFLFERSKPLCVSTVWTTEGVAVDVMFLPPNSSVKGMTVMPYAEFMKFVFRTDPALRGPVRSAFTGHVDTSDWQPGWARDRMPSKLESHLPKSTAQVLPELLRTQKGYAVVVDDTQPCAAMYALSTKAVSNMVKMVGQMVETGSIDRPSELLFLSFLRRHDHYVPALGESFPEELKLGYGPSMLYPTSNCLFAYREDNPDVRLDVGQDQSFANALKAPLLLRMSPVAWNSTRHVW
jgi:hypothetical protein